MHEKAYTIWMTGLSGSGKTTTAQALYAAFKQEGRACEWLDGDEVRQAIGKELGFSHEDRLENIRRIVYISRLLTRNGITVIVSAITPYRQMRQYAKDELPHMMEVYVECPLAVCEQRDPKGLYAKARRGQIKQFTGISDRYEEPLSPDVTIHTDKSSVEKNVEQIMNWLKQQGGG